MMMLNLVVRMRMFLIVNVVVCFICSLFVVNVKVISGIIFLYNFIKMNLGNCSKCDVIL